MALGKTRMLFTEFVPHETRVLPLLRLQPIGVARVLGEMSEIEFRDLARTSIAILVLAADETLRLQGLGHPKFVEHVERRRMKGRGTQGFG